MFLANLEQRLCDGPDNEARLHSLSTEYQVIISALADCGCARAQALLIKILRSELGLENSALPRNREADYILDRLATVRMPAKATIAAVASLARLEVTVLPIFGTLSKHFRRSKHTELDAQEHLRWMRAMRPTSLNKAGNSTIVTTTMAAYAEALANAADDEGLVELLTDSGGDDAVSEAGRRTAFFRLAKAGLLPFFRTH